MEDAQKNNQCELIENKTGKVLHTGSFYDCLGAFQRVCGFSYSHHRQYSFETYTITPKEEAK
jgi:hypothetical protein